MRGAQMVEHTVILDIMGGTKVLTCEALAIKNIEYHHNEVTVEGIKDTILAYKYLKEDEAKFDIVVVDNRPPSQNFNEQRDKESKEFKKSRNDMKTAKM